MLISPLLKHPGAYVDGQWDRDGEQSFRVRDPATGQVLAELPDHGGHGAKRAADAATRCMRHDAMSLDNRRAMLKAIAQLHDDHRDELARIITMENGKPYAEAQGEVAYAAGFYRQAARHMGVLEPATLDERPRDCLWTVHRRPAGVAALITPWNFPLAMMAKKLAGALGAGCAVVMKPAEQTPLSMIALMQLIDETLELPAGLINLVLGEPQAISDAWFAHPAVRIVSFTGSTEVGQRLIAASAANVKRLALELGGNAPFVVFDDANLDRAADELMPNKFRCSGQTCVCTNRVLVQQRVMETFARKVAERVAKLKVGHGMDEGVAVGPLIDRAGWDKVHAHVSDALARGATLVQGEPAERPAENFGAFYPPTVLLGLTPAMRIAHEETFGPVIALGGFHDEADLIAQANDTIHGLAAYVFTADAGRAARVAAQLHFGHVGLNTGVGPTPEAPFGGMKQSGFGREGGAEGLLEFTEIQTTAAGK